MKNGMFLRAQSHESARSVRVIQACFSRSLTSWHSLKAANILPILIKFIGLALSVVITQSSFAALTPGATPGSFNVSESGAANYSIPIAMPPSTAGMAPQLSLNYSSQGGNGLLGMGWSLGGLSAISRCPKTQATDGVRGSVNFDANDRFCLDGQRLIVVTGSYGADGAEYRTEQESFSRIISYGTAGNGPASFKVWTKSGQVMEFGVTSDARIEAQGKSSVAAWALNKVQDTVGNYFSISYTEDNANGQYYPTRIDYTGNASGGLTPYNSVQFVYETRPDITPMYHAGSVMKTTVRLKNVRSYVGVALVKDYGLVYGLSAASLSRLISFSECAGDGACLPSTTLTWQSEFAGSGPSGALNYHQISPSDWNPGFRPHEIADVNGDGRADILSFQANGLFVWLSAADANSANTVGYQQWSAENWDPSFRPHALADVNGDGKVDILSFQANGLFVWLSAINGNSIPTLGYQQWSSENWDPGFRPHGVADMNGDGKADVLSFQANGLFVWLSAISGNTVSPLGYQQWSTHNWDPAFRSHAINGN